MQKTILALGLASCLNGIFSEQADASTPILFDESQSPFVHTVHACTSDNKLMEVRFSFDIHPQYARSRLNTEEQLNSTITDIDHFVSQSLQPLWEDTLRDISFASIENGDEKPLQVILEALYRFTDENYNDMDIIAGTYNMIPVLRGGAFESSHEFCMP